MGTTAQPRVLERNGHRAEIVGTSKKCRLWIGGKLYSSAPFATVREARAAFVRYVASAK